MKNHLKTQDAVLHFLRVELKSTLGFLLCDKLGKA